MKLEPRGSLVCRLVSQARIPTTRLGSPRFSEQFSDIECIATTNHQRHRTSRRDHTQPPTCVPTKTPSPVRRSTLERASFTSVVTPRSSVSRTESLSPSSSSARTLVASRGPFSSEDNTRRVSLRRLPRSVPAVLSRPSVPSLVLPSTLSRRDDPRDQRLVPPPAKPQSRRARTSAPPLKAQRRLRRLSPLPPVPRDRPEFRASRVLRVHQRRSLLLLVKMAGF